MRAFEVYVNGEKVCTVGVPGGLAVVGARAGREGFAFYLSGLDLAAREDLFWATPPIGLGDEIRLVAVETDAVNAPERREPMDAELPEP